ncbi:UbiX family flavin prenyltransferase [Rhodococcus opacus]|uniref:Flavin prenyltransferase UbiX n=1 Tax=Rhodococcus opacus TaxID=37919 RepID=A0A076F3Q8_RHOOP|nr:UbiX family flavin prenyltransferase [Rhodococcus opacus]AII10419.1 hypothetical protein EP51_39660 [Rhodococcus opacus]
MRLVVGMTGATGAAIGIRMLEALREAGVETHLIISRWGRSTISHETERTTREVAALADYAYSPDDQAAPISSGSFPTDGMIIAPCSMKTIAGIRMGYGDGLIGRAADVTLKESRPLVLMARETPLSSIHLDNLLALARAGATIMPPVPAFYQQPATIDDLIEQTVMRALDQVGIAVPLSERWTGTRPAPALSEAPAKPVRHSTSIH